ncbi:hypothetical protein KCU73_g5497, partial [Aureobasidium melanogenum]
MGPPLDQANSPKRGLPVQSHLPRSTAVASRSTPSEPQVIKTNAQSCQRLNSQSSATQTLAASFKPHRALCEYEILAKTLSHLQHNPKVLAGVMRTCPLFFQAGARILWDDAKPSDLLCVQDPRRRLEFARFLQSLTLESHERTCGTEAIIDPASWRLKTLAVYNSGSRFFNSALILHYLSSTLQKLTVHDGALDSGERQYYLLDQHCLTHIPATCLRLSVLDLNVVLDVTSCQLSHFFQSMPHIKVLRLGNHLERVLDHAVMSAVFILPNLQSLVFKPRVSQHFAEELINTFQAVEILPSITFLEIYLPEGDCSAHGDLLRTLTTLEDLTISVHNNSEWNSVLHPGIRDGISTLWSLKRLNIHLDRGVDMTDQDLAALYPLENLTELGIWSQHGDTDEDVNNLHISPPHFRDALYVLELIGSGACVDRDPCSRRKR